jgi:hypothetical protein
MNAKTKQLLNRILLWILILCMAVWLLFPFYWAVNSSLKSENQLQMMPATFAPRDTSTQQWFVYTRNYASVLTNKAFLRGMLNSAIVALSVTVLALAIGSFAGFALGKLRYRGKTATMYTILLICYHYGLETFGCPQPGYHLSAFLCAFYGLGVDLLLPRIADGDHAIGASRWRLAFPDVLYDPAAIDGAGPSDDRSAHLHWRLE